MLWGHWVTKAACDTEVTRDTGVSEFRKHRSAEIHRNTAIKEYIGIRWSEESEDLEVYENSELQGFLETGG